MSDDPNVIQIDRRLCFECSQPAEHQHHVVPKVLGGTKTIPLCSTCHAKLHETGTTTSELVKTGQARARRQGVRIGQLPYGFQYSDQVDEHGRRVVVPVQSHIETINRIADLRELGHSYARIARILDEEGRETARGGRWSPGGVRAIVKRLSQENDS